MMLVLSLPKVSVPLRTPLPEASVSTHACTLAIGKHAEKNETTPSVGHEQHIDAPYGSKTSTLIP